MSYQLVRLSALSGKEADYNLADTDLVYTTLGTGNESLSSIKVTLAELTTYLGTNFLWVSGGATKKLYPKDVADTKLGIGTDSPDEMLTVTGNVKASGVLKIDGTGDSYLSGQVGIGKTSPSVDLDIESASSPTLKITDTTNTVTLKAAATDTEVDIGASTNHPLILQTNDTDRLKINTSGDVSIETANAYLNFNSTEGSSGYGIRDNAGTMEAKNSGGTWTEFPLILADGYRQLYYYETGSAVGGGSPSSAIVAAAQSALGSIPTGSYVFIRFQGPQYGIGVGNGGATITSYSTSLYRVDGASSWTQLTTLGA